MKRKALLSIVLLICLLSAVACGSTGEVSGGSTAVAEATPPAMPSATAASAVRSDAVTPTGAEETATTAPQVASATATVAAPQATAAAASTAPATVAEQTAGGDPATVIVNSLRALAHVKSYRLFQTIVSAKSAVTQTAEIVPPDRMHMTNSYAGSSVVGESIIVSPTMWLRAQDGSWVVSDASDISGMLQLSSDQAIVDVYTKSISNARLVGTDTVNGVATRLYQYNIELVEFNTKGSEKLWIGSADGLPYKRQSDTTVVMGEQSATATTTAFYSDFNSNITIEPPVAAAATAGAGPTTAAAAQTASKIDACTLISKAEAAGVLSGEIGDAQGLNSDDNGTHVSTCAYASGTTDGKSVYLSINQLDAAQTAQDIYEFSISGATGQAIPGIGDGAFWNSTTKQLLGLKGNVYFYLRVGGSTSDMDAAIALAAKVAARLP